MNRHTKKIKQLFVQGNTDDLEAFLQLTYDLYENRADRTGEIQRCSLVLENQLNILNFAEKDSISSAVSALCAAYDFSAFTEGFQRGATLILSLLSKRK